MRIRFLAVSILCALAAGPVRGASIGIYSDRDCRSCNLQIPAPPGYDTLFVRLSTEGLPWYENGTGLRVTFRIEGMPEGWWVVPSLEAEPDQIWGDPLAPDGVFLVYFWDHFIEGDCIPLYSIVVGPSHPGAEAVLRVGRSTFEACFGPTPDCPYVAYDLFEIWCQCVDAGTLYINTPGDCTVGVQPSSWSLVKLRFR